jgi:rfaE bifunctional protein nucleotidyltransferase chain/domain
MHYTDLIKSKILDQNDLSVWSFDLRQKKKSIVFTNGCFDVLHFGHVSYLAEARNLGDVLIIGLNSDSSVKKLKGESRPINDENARAMLLASLVFVDAVVIFNEDTPEKIIKMISPKILVKGGDYKIENIAGADFVIENGGSVEVISFVEGYSSSKIIKNI